MYARALLSLVLIIVAVILGSTLLQKYKQLGWTGYDLSKAKWGDEYKNVSITSIAFDSNDRLWATIDEADKRFALAMLAKDGTWKIYPLSDSKIPNGRISDIAIDKINRVWVGTKEGLELLKPQGNWEKILDQRVSNLATDPQGQIWAVRKDKNLVFKLSHLSNNKWKDYASETSELTTIFVDHEGQVWLSDGFQIDILKPDTSWVKDIALNIPNGALIRTFAIDNQNRIWIGAAGMLYVCNNKCAGYDSSNSGLAQNINAYNDFYDIAFDNENKLWISIDNKLTILDIDRALPASLIPRLMILKNVILLFLTYFYVARHLPEKKNALIGALGGGSFALFFADIALVKGMHNDVSIQLLGQEVIALLFVAAIGAIIGLLGGFLAGKARGKFATFISGGFCAVVFFFVLIGILYQQ